MTILEQHLSNGTTYPKGKQIMATVLTIMITPDQDLVKVYVFCFKDSILTFLSISLFLFQIIFLTYLQPI